MSTTSNTPGRDTTVREKIKDIWFEEFDFIKNPNMPEDLLDNLVNYVTAEKRQLLTRLHKFADKPKALSRKDIHDFANNELAALQGDSGAES